MLADEYVGWFTDVAPNGTTVFRLGYRDVANQVDPGVGITGNCFKFFSIFTLDHQIFQLLLQRHDGCLLHR
jgi:hypothetical protein